MTDHPARRNGPPYRRLDPALVTEAIDFARAGAANADVAAALGVHIATLYRYLADGRTESERRATGFDPDPAKDLPCDLYEGMRRAHARLAMRMSLRMVQAADNGEWKAAEAVLRRFPAYHQPDGGPALGGESPDDGADLAESALTEAQARAIAGAMRSFGESLLARVLADGVDEARRVMGELARDALAA